MTSIEIPETVDEIKSLAFSGCYNLTTAIVPAIVDGYYAHDFPITHLTLYGTGEIGKGAYYGNKTLEDLIIQEGVVSISSYAFCQCLKLKSVDIPSSVTIIENYAFEECSNLTSIYVRAQQPPTIAVYSTFPKSSTIYVPSSAVNDYKKTWSWYASQIVAFDFE